MGVKHIATLMEGIKQHITNEALDVCVIDMIPLFLNGSPCPFCTKRVDIFREHILIVKNNQVSNIDMT